MILIILNCRYCFRKATSRFKLNLFGFITRYGVGDLFLFNDKTSTSHYVNYLNNKVLPSVIELVGDRFVWQHDNCGFASSNVSLEYYHRINLNTLAWPPNSPDLNIIKNVWSLLQKRVNRLIFNYGLPANKEQLADYAYTAWYTIPNALIDNLYKSIPKRIEKFLSTVHE